MFTRWIPWRFLLRRMALSSGFVDPFALLSRFNRFAKPADLVAPTELLRAGAHLHARGLINSQAIQHNLDWVWPFWVEQQFNPRSPSFVPRAFALTHINLTHRNWTAVGVPGLRSLPLVDPRGLVTPLFDGWSLDFWVIDEEGATSALFPSRALAVRQRARRTDSLGVETHAFKDGMRLAWRTEVVLQEGKPVCHVFVRARSQNRGRLVVALRPFNPEGISFVERVRRSHDGDAWIVNKNERVEFGQAPDSHLFCNYQQGDVSHCLLADGADTESAHCDVGMASAAALYAMEPLVQRRVDVYIPLREQSDGRPATVRTSAPKGAGAVWDDALRAGCTIQVPNRHMKVLFDNAVQTLVLHTPEESLAGPFTYKRFWFRDAVLIGNALHVANLEQQAQRLLDTFLSRQTAGGYFSSQEGEWDSNGQVLWLAAKLLPLRTSIDKHWRSAIERGADWICRKRISGRTDKAHTGLLPAGFSAEHLGPNDYYYWDDFWAVAGLRAAAELVRLWSDSRDRAARYERTADELMESIERTLAAVQRKLGAPSLPASPSRRMDSGAVGSLAATYPLQLLAPEDPRVAGTADFLLSNCLLRGALFHDISHSGINPYLTLHLAQALLRAGDNRYWSLVEAIANLASSTGQWPEAIHPRLATGCMGDGQHVWAAAEWVMIMRYCFVREELANRELVLCSGLPASWLRPGERLHLGPTRTPWGHVSVSVSVDTHDCTVSWEADWADDEPNVVVTLPYGTQRASAGASHLHFRRGEEDR